MPQIGAQRIEQVAMIRSLLESPVAVGVRLNLGRRQHHRPSGISSVDPRRVVEPLRLKIDIN
ncbi:hypothetical protein A5N72_19305 [Prescottella equi]|nr:hypothetical protein A5N72_19305 [Prescottella equi]